MQPRIPFTCARCALLSALLIPLTAQAVQLDYLLGLGIEHNDNVNFSDTDQISADILRPMLGFNVTQQGSTVQASASGVLEYRDYLGGEFSDEFRGQLGGHLNWTMIPERLQLTTEDYLSLQPINQLNPDSPANLQQTNVFAIGPTLGFRLGPTVRGQAELRYIDSYAQDTGEFNTQRISAAVRAIKDLDTTSALSANVTGERVHFTDSETEPDYGRYSTFGRYTRTWTKLNLVTDLGYSWLRYSGPGTGDRGDPLLRTDIGWHASESSMFTLNLAYQFSDAASSLMTVADIGNTIPTNIAVGDATVTSQPFLERRIGIGYTYQGTRAGFGAAPYYRKIGYVSTGAAGQSELDQTGRGALLNFSWRLRPLISVGIAAIGEKLRYDRIAREDRTWSIQVFLQQQLSRHWSWHADISRYNRDISTGQSSDQNILFAGITYTR